MGANPMTPDQELDLYRRLNPYTEVTHVDGYVRIEWINGQCVLFTSQAIPQPGDAGSDDIPGVTRVADDRASTDA